jgi:hypothetical protein
MDGHGTPEEIAAFAVYFASGIEFHNRPTHVIHGCCAI